MGEPTAAERLPCVDEHSLAIAAGPEATWDALLRVVGGSLSSRADLPRLRGSIYRTLVIGTRAHVLVMRRLLGSAKRRAERERAMADAHVDPLRLSPGVPPRGLCDSCRHQKLVPNTRGSIFSLCLRSRRDERFPRYPRLPVLDCLGYEARNAEPPPGSEGDG